MVKVRHIPEPIHGAFGQPERMHFEDDDRIVLADGIDWRRHLTNDDGHVFQAEHDAEIRRSLTHAKMRIESDKPGFRHDAHWYATAAMTARLRADVSDMSDLPFEERQLIMWKEEFILAFEALEKLEPKTVTRGDDPLTAAIARIHNAIKQRHSAVNDRGKRKYSGRLKQDFDHAPGPKAFLTWMKDYISADRDPLVLCSRKYRSGNRDERLDDDQIKVLKEFAPRFAAMNKPSILGLHGLMKAHVENVLNPKRPANSPIKVPSYGRLQREIHEMKWFETLAGRSGVANALNQARPQGDGIPDVRRAIQHVEMDHWNVGLRTILTVAGIWPKLNRKSRRNLRIVRMNLGAAICRRTHCVVAMTLTPTASTDSVIRLIEMAICDKKRFADAAGCITPYDIFGIMENLFMDGGPAFNNSMVRAVLRDLQVEPEYPVAGLPHFRGMIERLFRKIDDQVISWFEGRTFSNVVQKGDYNPDSRTGTSVEELGRVLVRFVVDRHHNTPLKELGWETPRECYLKLGKAHGIRPFPGPDTARNVFGFEDKRMLGPNGLRFLNIQYRSRTLHEQFLKTGPVYVTCRFHPADLGAISVKFGKQWLTVNGPSAFKGVDADTWIAAEAVLRAKGEHTLKHITGPIINAAILEVVRVAEAGHKRAGIEDNPIRRKALLAAEAGMRIFADFPDELDEEAEEPGDVYETAVEVATPPPARRAPRAKPPKTASSARAAAGTPKAVKSGRPKPVRDPKRAPARRPGLKRGWTAKD
jgi:putative transposase